MPRKHCFNLCLLTLLFSATSADQTVEATLSGSIADPSGAAIAPS
jgi:hypothetical protein